MMTFSMKEALLAISMLTQQGADLPPSEVMCMARSIYHEARGENVTGQVAVAYVKMERARSARYPGSICEVVTEDRGPGARDCQFSWFCDGRSDVPKDWGAYQDATLVAIEVMTGRVSNPAPGATLYYAHNKVTPGWSRRTTEVAVLGNHRFMEE